ncbi:MAG TPA: GNAT family N-acetyltransferase [Bacilli bacterium]|nr:GNAT family N-acetyltransferase [Bacilli bacterium]
MKKNYANENYDILVVKENNKVIGSATIYKINLFTFSFQPALEIFNVAVLPEYRRKNVATKIFDYIIDYANKNGYKSVYLTCLDDAIAAHKLYESVGFKKASSIKYNLDLRK